MLLFYQSCISVMYSYPFPWWCGGVAGVMEVFGNIVPVQIFNDHDRLITLRPSHYAKERAEQEAHYLWLQYVKHWLPDEYAKIPNGTSFSPLAHDKLV